MLVTKQLLVPIDFHSMEFSGVRQMVAYLYSYSAPMGNERFIFWFCESPTTG